MKSKKELTISDVKPFSEAISLTPYDPAAYNLRALAYLGITKRVNETLHDLERALQLDRLNERACYLVRNLRDVVDGRAPPYTGLEISEGDRSYLSRIQEKFGILSR
jgi:hypothetical protein